MNAREKLNKLKDLWGLRTDSELADFLETSKLNIDSWVKRDKIPEKWELKIGQMHESKPASSDADMYFIRKTTSVKASAGGGNEIDDIKAYETGKLMPISRAFFKTPPKKELNAIEISGESMMPMLHDGDWVIFCDDGEFKGDGLYVVNFSGQLMAKVLQLSPKGELKIISVNPNFKSYEIDINETQEHFRIIGKVIKSII